MTELQKVELDILQVFTEVCEELGLCYYLVCGSALGAVKYGGFIPWDDDVDVGMPREDYARFLREAPSRLPEHLFLQNYRTDPAFPHIFSKLRDSRTTYVETNLAHLDMNHGVYIDVFPLDGYPEKKWEQRILDLRKKVFSWKQYCALKWDPKRKVRIRNRIFRLFGYHKRTAKTLAAMDAMFCSYPAKFSKVWCNHGNWQGKLEYASREQYGDGVWAVFEGLPVRIPENYDAYLAQKYGQWREELPEEKHGHHFYSVCDLQRSYKEYVSKKTGRHSQTGR